MNLKELSRPLTIDDIDFRVQSINAKGYATILAYKDARIDMQRLDQAVGPLNWQRKHELIDGKLFCHVGLYNPETSQWTWKSDVGTESMTEATKGEASDSFKRACFNWGIGRELYDYPIISIKLVEKDEYEVTSGRAKQTWGLRLRDWTWFSQFTDGKISYIACKDTNGKLRFQWGTYVKEETSTPTPAPKVNPSNDPDANPQGVLKKKTDAEIELEALTQEYISVIGKKPTTKMTAEMMREAIDKELNESLSLSLYEQSLVDIKKHTTKAELKQWAMTILEQLKTSDPDNLEAFKNHCNNHALTLNN
jgi:hypothetical protein